MVSWPELSSGSWDDRLESGLVLIVPVIMGPLMLLPPRGPLSARWVRFLDVVTVYEIVALLALLAWICSPSISVEARSAGTAVIAFPPVAVWSLRRRRREALDLNEA